MNISSIFAQVVALVGGTMVQLRHRGTNLPQAIGTTPSIPAAVPQGALPTLKMPTIGFRPIIARNSLPRLPLPTRPSPRDAPEDPP